jgi:hypothetical protein
VLNAKLLYAACYAGAKNDTTRNSISVLTVQYRSSGTCPLLTKRSDADVCSSPKAGQLFE